MEAAKKGQKYENHVASLIRKKLKTLAVRNKNLVWGYEPLGVASTLRKRAVRYQTTQEHYNWTCLCSFMVSQHQLKPWKELIMAFNYNTKLTIHNNAGGQCGCTCAILDNHRGAGFGNPPQFWITEGCPLHDKGLKKWAKNFVANGTTTCQNIGRIRTLTLKQILENVVWLEWAGLWFVVPSVRTPIGL